MQNPKLNELTAPPIRIPWQRLVIGSAFLSLGVTAILIGASSISYRLTHLVVDGGVMNGRIVRLRSPIDGNIGDFYARPGVPVESGQVLARVNIDHTTEQSLLQLESDLQAKKNQLQAVSEVKSFLENQLGSLSARHESVWTVETALTSSNASQQQAVLDGAIAQAATARTTYQRYQQLLNEGAVSAQQVDELRAAWESAEAEVRRAQEVVEASKEEVGASRSRTIMSQYPSLSNTFTQDISQLKEQIQSYSAQMATLRTEVLSAEQRLKQARSLYSDRQDLEIAAPMTGVVYRTEQEGNEQVNRSEPILTLLDCSDLWIEVVMSAKDASQINTQRPVSVELAGYSDPMVGEVDLMQPISGVNLNEEQNRRTQVQALVPVIPPHLLAQPLTRVTVRVPPPTNYEQSQQFCGVGQGARLTFSKQSAFNF
ncbi:HlyD family efflux transporter periplasmic adaptor subunit [Oscillatoria sp. FACHB-1407]|uniref:HlyD family secretion protein n=1 Tax=Oscillatoria sp. FACHB-1407 TaxID=2692847 RepID=UPI001686281A|nr:HlyD family efflux transporter periplasmic adaptor subunit [Oscillatoria sp. FACHB-1407]MBD2461919.1 HlyD family efflux transporter periplasmic adaptor subunit [Oscillatoria sp. FACHB-1407]